MAISLRNRCPVSSGAQLIDAASEINTMIGVANQRLQKGQNLMCIMSNHKYTDSSIVGNEGQIIYQSKEFMAPWTRVGTHTGNLIYSAKEERLAAAELAAAVGAPQIAIAQAKFDKVKFSLDKDYSVMYPDWDYEAGLDY